MLISRDKAQAAADLLGVKLEGLTTSALGRAFRSRAARYHPDTALNFNADRWQAICEAKRDLLTWLDKNPPASAPANACRACGGAGRVRVARGFKVTTVQCIMCHGAGVLPEEKSRAHNPGD